jgi:hypothetical protein
MDAADVKDADPTAEADRKAAGKGAVRAVQEGRGESGASIAHHQRHYLKWRSA